MERSIDDVLAQYSVESRIVGELHDVPPYRVCRIRFGDREAVLKVDDHPRGHAADEGRVHEYVDDDTSAAVPAALAVGSDHYITAWEDDVADASEQLDADWARAAGAWLGTLHADTAGAFGGFGRPRNADGCLDVATHDDWIDAASERVGYHRTYLSTIGYADVADDVSRFFREHPDVFDGAGAPVLCHGDVHPEHHVRTGDGGVIGIDFEHALVAPAEYDYWRTVMPYFEARDDVDERVTRAFRDGYESVRSLPDDVESRRPAYRLLNLVAFLESLYLQGNAGPEERETVGKWMRSHVAETLEELRERMS